ncbi:MAG: peroxiredoxin [Proteobacteria bacterium]|nr:peroxiredoxin [Pseudomonadota bacterium]
MAAPAIGKKIPDFKVDSTAGAWRLKDNLGTKLVVYFYPRDNTSGCTKESEAFRDHAADFKKAKTAIVGVSADSLVSHEKFRAKYAFPFHLLADTDQELCKLFDVIKEKSMYGKKYMGIERSTFLLDDKGVLRAEWRKVKVDGHATAVLAAARDL